MPFVTVNTYTSGVLVATRQEFISVETENRQATMVKAQQALAVNATYLALVTPSAAQNTAQAKALTRQVNGLIRLLLGALSDVSDT